MIIPVRCFSCGKPIAEHYDAFQAKLKKGEKMEDIFKEMGITRYCCKRMLSAHVESIDEIMKYNA